MSLVEAVTDPDSFFGRELPDGALVPALGILAVFAVTFGGVVFVIGQTIAGAANLTGAEQETVRTVLLVGAVVTGGVSVLSVLFITGLYHLGTALVGGTGSLRDTFIVTAWALLPSILSTLVGGVTFVLGFEPPPGLNDAQAALTRAQSFQSTPVALVVNAAATLWQVYVVGYGLSHARNVTVQKGFAVAVVVTALLFGVQAL